MSRYVLSSGSIVNTESATWHCDDSSYWDGSNLVSRVAGKYARQTLYRTRRGLWYLETHHRGVRTVWEGSQPSAEPVSVEQAARWMIDNQYEPDDTWPADLRAALKKLED